MARDEDARELVEQTIAQARASHAWPGGKRPRARRASEADSTAPSKPCPLCAQPVRKLDSYYWLGDGLRAHITCPRT